VPTVSTDFGGISDLLEGQFGKVVQRTGRGKEEVVADLADTVIGVISKGGPGDEEKMRWHDQCASKYDLPIFQQTVREKVLGLVAGIDWQRRERVMDHWILDEFSG